MKGHHPLLYSPPPTLLALSFSYQLLFAIVIEFLCKLFEEIGNIGIELELWQRRKENCFFLAEQRLARLFFFFSKIEWGAHSRVWTDRVQGRELCLYGTGIVLVTPVPLSLGPSLGVEAEGGHWRFRI